MHQKRPTRFVIKHWLTHYFSLTKREYNAVLALLGLISLTIVTPYIYESFSPKEELMTDYETKAIHKLTLIDQEDFRSKADRYRRPNAKELKAKITLFKFDPNQIDVTDWEKLGLSTKQAQSILNYRSKGGKFYKVDDVKKMYAISPTVFERLQPYIHIEAGGSRNEQWNTKHVKMPVKQFISIEINTADTTNLDQVKGIGPTFARRIVSYRGRLGGFYKKEQLMEVYGLDSLKFNEIKGQIQIDPSLIKKIDINTADFEIFKNHPYLKYKQINAIIQYRKQHGNYTSIADLKKLLILSSQTIEQLTPYLQF
ncbi:ComEA family DNA-binding protein [Pedobacter insulae]|uniref:Competence protein ComEA helix-hairpin-helix repeat region n=1 Tax=Pedobacter insulae TaxID=414048 RepID=A0A1I2Y2K7_9SPHI|nr:helix-hairpin-helix domain-containing protein [Pedobacter insulae]SFH18561.1 competence protein ComEA helix-hairpin-helix repeat region [Pedobacter insulae]